MCVMCLQLTSLCLQHCGLSDDSITGLTNLTRLQRLEVSDNLLTTVALQHIAVLTRLTHLDLSVMPAIQRMRGSHTADLQHLNKLQVGLVTWRLPSVRHCTW